MNEHHPRLSAIGLVPAKYLTAFAVEDAQPYRSGWPRDIGSGDDCGRNVHHLNLHVRQNRWSAIGRSAGELDSKPMQLRIKDALQFVRRRKPLKKSWLARRSRLAIGKGSTSMRLLILRATANAIWPQSFAIASELASCSLRRASQ